MEGRWTICIDSDGDVFDQQTAGSAVTTIPVVPCDDAAIERGAAILRALLGDMLGTDTEVREMAWAVLRAAGETT